MSIATVWFKAELFKPGSAGLMRAHARSIDKEHYIAINKDKKTIVGHLGVRNIIWLREEDIEIANTEAWEAGVTWAKKYIQTGYGAGEKSWEGIPEDKRS